MRNPLIIISPRRGELIRDTHLASGPAAVFCQNSRFDPPVRKRAVLIEINGGSYRQLRRELGSEGRRHGIDDAFLLKIQGRKVYPGRELDSKNSFEMW